MAAQLRRRRRETVTVALIMAVLVDASVLLVLAVKISLLLFVSGSAASSFYTCKGGQEGTKVMSVTCSEGLVFDMLCIAMHVYRSQSSMDICMLL
jgi:hypothetical protein